MHLKRQNGNLTRSMSSTLSFSVGRALGLELPVGRRFPPGFSVPMMNVGLHRLTLSGTATPVCSVDETNQISIIGRKGTLTPRIPQACETIWSPNPDHLPLLPLSTGLIVGRQDLNFQSFRT